MAEPVAEGRYEPGTVALSHRRMAVRRDNECPLEGASAFTRKQQSLCGFLGSRAGQGPRLSAPKLPSIDEHEHQVVIEHAGTVAGL